MQKDRATRYLNDWLNQLDATHDIRLLNTQEDGTTIVRDGLLITRSIAFSKNIESIKMRFCNSDLQRPEGVLYLIYWRKEYEIEPLYVGKASVLGKNGKTTSALFGKNGFIRFAHGINSKGHIGNLNEACNVRENNTESHAYLPWLKTMFANDRQNLIKPVFVKMQVWERNSCCCIPELEHVSLETEEALRIELIRQAGRGDVLLNRIGNY